MMQHLDEPQTETWRLPKVDLNPVPGVRWIKRDALQAWRTGQNFIVAAQVQAQKIIEQARIDAEHKKQQGYDAGYAQGRDEWMEKILHVQFEQQQKLDREKNVLAELALEAVLQLLGEMSEEEWYVRCLKKIDSIIGKEVSLTLFIHPDNQQGLQQALDQLQSNLSWRHLVKVELDPSLSIRSCLLMTERGSVNVSQEFQLKSVMTAFENYFDIEAGSLCSRGNLFQQEAV